MAVVIQVGAEDRVRRVVFAGGDPRKGLAHPRAAVRRADRYVLILSF